MKIEDMIKKLEEIKKDYGNIEVVVNERKTGFEYYGVVFKVMQEYAPDGSDICLLYYS